MNSLINLRDILDDGATLSGIHRMPTFLNARDQRYALNMVVTRELGIIARIALIFSRRGLDIATFNLRDADAVGISKVSLEFDGSDDQLRTVVNDLKKLVDVYSVATTVVRCESNRPTKAQPLKSAIYSTSAMEQL